MGVVPQMPELPFGGYLLEAFLNMKIATSFQGETQPRSWAEVLAYAQATGAVTQPWELQALFDMSWDYVHELNKATSPFVKSPMERAKNG